MSVRDTLNKIENLVAGASHLPLTGKALIDEENLADLVEELRQELPQELEHAEKIMSEKDLIIQNARKDADDIIKQAKMQAEQMIDESDVVMKAREKSRMVLSQAQAQEAEVMERTRRQSQQLQDDVDRYANQVFDQLISHVGNTFQSVKNLEAGLDQAAQILHQAKAQMNQQAVQYTYAHQPPAYNQQQ
ncbi:MAG: ATPase [Selenomonadaceae bacterium]|nr:ATPase [Selenomonadaceae bacterium]